MTTASISWRSRRADVTPFWPLYIEPLLGALKPERILQVGAGDGELSARLVAHGLASGAALEIVDPRPPKDLEEGLGATVQRVQPWKPAALTRHADLVLLDGEPNWWAVFTILGALRRLAAESGAAFPVVLAHHAAWPYARRDMYPTPELVQEAHPYAYLGVDPDRPQLVQDGIGARFAHAVREGGVRNGVLTALEDFAASATVDLQLWTFPLLGGLAILAPPSRVTPELRTMIEGFSSPEASARAVDAASAEARRLAARLAEAEARLDRRTAALERARELIARQEADLAALRQQLKGKPA